MVNGTDGEHLPSDELPEDDPRFEDHGLLDGIPDDEDELPGVPTEIRLRRDDPSGTIVLDRPACRNALTRRTLTELETALDDLHRAGPVRAVILTGAGSAFCAGTDLREIRSQVGDDEQRHLWKDDADRMRRLLQTMLRFPKPIIAAVNGPVRGFGIALLAACDIVVASERADFALPEARIGLVAAQAAPLLSFRIGAGATSYLMLTGRTIDAQRAREIGLVHETVRDDLVWARAQELAKECARGARESIQLAKRLINETIGETLELHDSVAAAYTATARTTESAAEGVRAFLERRPPRWS